MTPLAIQRHTLQTRPAALGFGAGFSNTLCLIEGERAWLTEALGDLNTAEACLRHQAALAQLSARLSQLQAASKPEDCICVHDRHPDFYSTHSALDFAAQSARPAYAVQHHHAHIAAVCAEHGLHGPVLGLAWDGMGLGSDAQAWGSECLWVAGSRFKRLAHHAPLALIGGDKAATQPWRVALALIHAAAPAQAQALAQQRFGDEAALPALSQMLEKNVQCPQSSSMGRLFDGVAALLGLSRRMQTSGAAPKCLEVMAQAALDSIGWECLQQEFRSLRAAAKWQAAHHQDAGLPQLHWQPFIRALLAAAPSGQYSATQQQRWAAYLHIAVVQAWVQAVQMQQMPYAPSKQQPQQPQQSRLPQALGLPVVLAGGCFFNRILRERLTQALQGRGYLVYAPEKCQPGDAAIALGQAWIGLFET